MLPTLPPKSRTFLPRQSGSPSCCEKYVNCPVFVDRNTMALRLAIEKLAIEIIRAAAVVQKSREQHDHKHPFAYADVCFGAHETQLERRQQRHRSLPALFFDIRELRCAIRRPVAWTLFANPDEADSDAIAGTRHRTLRNAACFVIRVEPAAQQFFLVRHNQKRSCVLA